MHQRGDFMPLSKPRAPRNSTRPKETFSVNSSSEIVWVKIVAHEPSQSIISTAVAAADEAARHVRCDAIEDQCARLVNVVGAVHCMSIGIVTQTERPAPEFCAAFSLLEQEILSIVGCLKGIALRAEMPGVAVSIPGKGDAETPVIHGLVTD
jgi:hypothetical protein